MARSSVPPRIAEINDAVRHLGNTLARTKTIRASKREQLVGMVAHFARQRLAGGGPVDPGVAKMARWGKCAERQARRNFRALVDAGVVIEVDPGGGGRASTQWEIDFIGLTRFLKNSEANPHVSLTHKLEVILRGDPAIKKTRTLDRTKNPDNRPVSCPVSKTGLGGHRYLKRRRFS